MNPVQSVQFNNKTESLLNLVRNREYRYRLNLKLKKRSVYQRRTLLKVHPGLE